MRLALASKSQPRRRRAPRAILRDRDGASILLLRRAVEPGFGAWDLPAGYLDPGESFEQAARRETREETGLAAATCGHRRRLPLAVRERGHRRVPRRGRPDAPIRLDAESSEHAWVSRSAIADWLPRMAFPSMAAAVSDWASGHGWPVSDDA